MVTRKRVHLPADGQTGRAVAAVADLRPASREASQRRLTADSMEEPRRVLLVLLALRLWPLPPPLRGPLALNELA